MPCGNICHFKTEQVFPQAIDSEKCSEIKKKKKKSFPSQLKNETLADIQHGAVKQGD